MARLVGVLGTSHAPSIAFAHDAGHQDRPEWRGFFGAWGPVREWIARIAADTAIVVYNDHLNTFQLDRYPTFALGVAERFEVAREGREPRALPALPGDLALGWHVARSLVEQEFDPCLCQEMPLDHGVLSVWPLLDPPPWRLRVVPIAVNVVLEPLPTPRRCWRLGLALARAIASAPGDARVLVVSAGGLSHQLHGPDFGFVNTDWDRRFLDLVEHDPQPLVQATHEDYIERGGAESVEMMVWLAMRGALHGAAGGSVRRVARFHEAPMLTGYGLLALEPVPSPAPAQEAA
jgi:hypothetical protein